MAGLTDILNYLPSIMQLMSIGTKVKSAIAAGESAIQIVRDEASEVIPILQAAGEALFPSLVNTQAGATGEMAVQAALDVVFDTDGVKWVQNSLNTLGQQPPLDADGLFGPKTKAAVTAYQNAHGLKPDGYPGPKTSAQLALDVAHLPAK